MAKVRRVFISHDSEDAHFAHRLAEDLQRFGVQVWIAPDSVRPGEGWVAAIKRGLSESNHMLVVLTSAAVESQWVRKATDVAVALERKGRMQVIPLDVKPCAVPLLLSSYQMVSLRSDYNVGLRQIAEILGLRLPAEPAKGPFRPAEPPVAVPEPVRPAVMERTFPFEPEMILIPAGEFLMGSDPQKDKDATDREQPQHSLYLPDYAVAKTPVTQVQYAAFVQATGHRAPNVDKSWAKPYNWSGTTPPKGKEDHPVVLVSWDDAIAYCNWLAQITGKPYRLPSEAEWEKAARGTDGRIYPWGNWWDAKRCNTLEGGKGGWTPVGLYPQGASPYGLLDMAGNIWDWCSSLSKPYPYRADDGRENLDASGERLRRGGAWDRNGWFVRCAYRLWDHPGYRVRTSGFRVVVAVP